MLQRTSTHAFLALALGSLLIIGAGCAANTKVTGDVTPPQAGGNAANPGSGQPDRGGNVPPAIGRMPARKLVATMGALNGSGQSGAAEITEENGKTTVTVTLAGEPAGATEPSHIHAGACPNPGDVVWSLNDVVDGKSVTTLDVPLAEMIAKMPIAINVHKSSADIPTYESCGDLAFPSDRPGAAAGGEASVGASGNAGGAAAGIAVNADAGLRVDPSDTPPAKEFRITAKQFSYSPSEIRVKLGDKVRIVATSVDVTHGLSIPAFNVNLTLQPGTESTAEFVADQQGTFPFFCTTFCGSGHTGMRGTLIVE